MTRNLFLLVLFANLSFQIGCATSKGTESYFDKVVQSSKSLQIDRLIPIAEQAADRLIRGGNLYVAGEAGPVGELSYRSGGPMMIRRLFSDKVKSRDVILYFPEKSFAKLKPKWESKMALVVTFDKRLQKQATVHPTLEKVTAGSVFLAELIAAFTRKGKMPVLFETIGRYDGHPRIAKFKTGKIPFHKIHNVTTIPAKKMSQSFILELDEILSRGKNEWRPKIKTAQSWIQATNTKNGRIYLYSMGHFYPHFFKTVAPKGWLLDSLMAGFTNAKIPNYEFSQNDLIVFVGAHHPPLEIFPKIKRSGAKIVYISLRNHRDYIDRKNFLWIDPLWPWQDAILQIPGSDVPAIAASGIINASLFMEITSASQPNTPKQ